MACGPLGVSDVEIANNEDLESVMLSLHFDADTNTGAMAQFIFHNTYLIDALTSRCDGKVEVMMRRRCDAVPSQIDDAPIDGEIDTIVVIWNREHVALSGEELSPSV